MPRGGHSRRLRRAAGHGWVGLVGIVKSASLSERF